VYFPATGVFAAAGVNLPGSPRPCSGSLGWGVSSQVVSEQLGPGRHAQTCSGIFGIAEASTGSLKLKAVRHEALLRPFHIPIIPWELSLNEASRISKECLLVSETRQLLF
jgi:hypothetical protein